MQPFEQYITDLLSQKRADQSLRSLRTVCNMADFCSNDYIGLARSSELRQAIHDEYHQVQHNGATGSRLLSGNTAYTEMVEQEIADFHRAQAALLYNTGYNANMGIIAAVARTPDLILYDELVHASMHDGMRLSRATAIPFKHNDTDHLQHLLQTHTARFVFVLTESLFSMDGDVAPLAHLQQLAEQYGAHLMVDEAHATGIYGHEGGGLVQELTDPALPIFARIHTFGKALGVHGAAVLGSQVLRQYLVNFSRPFIFSTATTPHSIAAIRCAYRMVPHCHKERDQLTHIVSYFRKAMTAVTQTGELQLVPSCSPIQAVIIPGNEHVRKYAARLQANGLDVRPIISPTVAKGTERLRICLHSYNTTAEIDLLCGLLHAPF